MRVASALFIVVLLAGCETLPPVGPPCGSDVWSTSIAVSRELAVSVLFVVDGAGRSDAERAAMTTAVLEPLRSLAGDLDGDGVAEVAAWDRMHVGVVSADVGDDGAGLPGCTAIGDDGRMRTATSTGWLDFEPTGDVDALLDATRGSLELAMRSSCARSRPLDAVRLALLGSSSTVVPGHVPRGDTEHSGFVEPASLLSIVFVAPRDDCSGAIALDPLRNVEAACLDAATVTPGDVALELASVHAYPSLFVASVLGGVPLDATVTDLEAALAAATPMLAADGSVAPLCSGPAGAISPTPRLLRFLSAMSAADRDVALDPLCDPSGRWADATLSSVASALSLPGSCVPRPAPRDATGLTGCTVILTLPPRAERDRVPSCVALGLEPESGEGTDRERCSVPEIPWTATPPDGYAFFYDDTEVSGAYCAQRLVLTFDGRAIDSHSELFFSCTFYDVADAGLPPCW